MLSEYLDAHPLEPLLPDAFPAPFPTAEDRDAWERLPARYRREIEETRGRYAAQPYPVRRATDFLAFVRTGSRRADEDAYFFRRRKLCAAALACCADENESLDDVIDGIWTLCEETSWVISAHNVNPIPGAPSARDYPLPDPDRPYIDLFSAQTAMILALTGHLLGKRLDAVTPMLTARVRREIRLRVLDPFLKTDDFWWMGVKRKDLNNWTPWIVSNILLCVWLSGMEKARAARCLERGLRMLDRWIAVMPPDGGCDEGAGYWNMAGGAMLDCLEIVETLTDGRVRFWQDEKIRNILLFPLRAEIGNGWFVNFADCDARPALSGERIQRAGEKIGDAALEAMGRRLRGGIADTLSDVPHFYRLLNLLFHPAGEEPAAESRAADTWLPALELRAVRRNGLTLCCKGGHNGENHNHNDVGSFMLYVDGEPCAVDAGNMTYTAKTFSGERYTLWNVRSTYHNVPLVNGQEQRPGREYAAKEVQALPDGLALDIGSAYGPEAGILSWRRETRLTEDGMTLRDRFALGDKGTVSWVFMLRNEPKITERALVSGPVALLFPAEMAALVEEIPVADPRMARSFPGSLWRAVLTLEHIKEGTIDFQFQRR